MPDPTPEMIRFRCPCGAKLKAPPEKVGQEVGCPTCLAKVVVPQPERRPAKEVDLAEVDDSEIEEEPKPRRRPRRDRDDGIPIRRRDDDSDYDDRPRRRRRKKLPPNYLKWAIIGGGSAFLGMIPIGFLVSQYSPIFGSWFTAIAEPFSPARMQSAPIHCFAFAFLGLFLGSAIGAGACHLQNQDPD